LHVGFLLCALGALPLNISESDWAAINFSDPPGSVAVNFLVLFNTIEQGLCQNGRLAPLYP